MSAEAGGPPDAVETKLSAARARLILDKPFLGALVLRMPLQPAQGDWCETTATDARKLYFNPDYIRGLSAAQTQFVLAHEALHCALSHFARRQHRIQKLWDIACDHAINPLLLEEGLIAPPNALVNPAFYGMTAEEIYPCLDTQTDEQPMDQHIYDQPQQGGSAGQSTQPDEHGGTPEQQDKAPGKSAAPPPLTPDERDNLAVQWQQRLAGAAQQARMVGKLGGALGRMVEHLLQPSLPWRSLLARYLTASAREDYSFARPSTRRGDPAVFPSLRSGQVDLVVVVDVSGSIGRPELDSFLGELDALKGQVRARVCLHACDAELAAEGPWEFEAWEPLRLPPKLTGGGGTSFVPVFDWVRRQGRRPDALLYFTDAEGEFPGHEPDYPVIWLIKGRRPVPWGRRIQLN